MFYKNDEDEDASVVIRSRREERRKRRGVIGCKPCGLDRRNTTSELRTKGGALPPVKPPGAPGIARRASGCR